MVKEGQTWLFYGDDSTKNSYLIIRKIEANEQCKIVHVSIKDVVLDGELWDIAHLPVEHSVLIKSLKLQKNVNLDRGDLQEFEEAYIVWKKDNGGVWSMEIKDVIKNTLANAGLR